MFDYHVHTHFSPDSSESMQGHIQQAKKLGLQGLCFCDHYEYEFPDQNFPCDLDFAELKKEFSEQDSQGMELRLGVEMGVREEEQVLRQTEKIILQQDLDFVIASVHHLDGQDPYFPSYFEGKTREEGFARYLKSIYWCVRRMEVFCAAGHIDYPAKGCPYSDKRLLRTDAPDVLDALFKNLIERGKCMEINTSVLAKTQGQADLQVLRRYVELGGEFVTFGSDGHKREALGQYFSRGKELARQAGIRYAAIYEKRQPRMIPLEQL
jgi:histidinol-phosphatase (PHP family)